MGGIPDFGTVHLCDALSPFHSAAGGDDVNVASGLKNLQA